MDIPIVIISYNNWKYIRNTLKQLSNFEIIIMDNKSTDPESIEFLKNTPYRVVWNKKNNGPWITPDNNTDLWNDLPNRFILTDPDLQFNPNLPKDFLKTFIEISDLHNAYKVGFALDISDYSMMYQIPDYHFGQSIYQWEHSQHWTRRLEHPEYELYLAPLDTTFCMISKNKNPYNNVRIAGNFTAKHLPWYVENPIYNVYSNYVSNKLSTKISNMSEIIVKDILQKYKKIVKNDETFFIQPKGPNSSFWESHYPGWEPETFEVLDNFLTKDTIFIDIGAWVGPISMYASRKSKEVYSVEADSMSIHYLQKNCKNNCENNIHFIHKAIYSKSNENVLFGKNLFLPGSVLNDSTSQIVSGREGGEGYSISTISFSDLIRSINPKDISLIKVDIEGGEENILDDLFSFYNNHSVPMYISFHVDWWKNQDLSRFENLKDYSDQIKENPFVSILFHKCKFRFFYGTDSYYIEITDVVLKKCYSNGTITIPTNDEHRAQLFGDPLVGILKWFYIHQSDGTVEKYSDNVVITIKDENITTEVIIKPVIVAIAKLEIDYIYEWVKYHLSLGFDKIYLYDNEDSPVYSDIFSKNNKVSVIHLPGNNYSKPVQYHALEHFIAWILPNKNITHVAHIDIDEFIALKKHDSIKDFIKEYFVGNTGAIGMNWRHFGDSGHISKNHDPVTKRFTMCESKGNQTIKTLFDKSHFLGWRICHCVSLREPYVTKSTNGEIIPESYTDSIDYSVIQLNHYKCKTRPEFTHARTRGRCDISDTHLKTDNDDFDRFNFNEVHELTAYRFYNNVPEFNFGDLTSFLNFQKIVPVEGNSGQIPEQMEDLVYISKNAKNILEIGFNAGHSSELFLKNNPGCNIVSFDLGEHSYVQLTKEYIDYVYPNRHTLITGDSTISVPKYTPGFKFDLIFIDGGHQLEIAQQDLLNCILFAHSETIVAMDDITFDSNASWTVGPTRAWVDARKSGLLSEIVSKEYSPGRGMSWGKYSI
jgi:FkbM family methyltransferase